MGHRRFAIAAQHGDIIPEPPINAAVGPDRIDNIPASYTYYLCEDDDLTNHYKLEGWKRRGKLEVRRRWN